MSDELHNVTSDIYQHFADEERLASSHNNDWFLETLCYFASVLGPANSADYQCAHWRKYKRKRVGIDTHVEWHISLDSEKGLSFEGLAGTKLDNTDVMLIGWCALHDIPWKP